ncbi:hypothetical protein DFP73DRAFT_535484 [Morchella snyderi]|nr:hypothetical protein DFP73DRAFT_535484 [Morchella snyderi]
MEGASATTTPKNSSRPSSRGSNHKRQRADPKKAMESSADFISLDFSDGTDDEPVEVEYLGSKRPKRTPSSTGNNTPVTTNAHSTEDEDDEEGGVEEKTAKKNKKRRKLLRRLSKEGENDTKQEADKAKQPMSPSLNSKGDSSDEAGGVSIGISSNGARAVKDDESENDDEDKDYSTRRALNAKRLNGARTPGREDAQKPGSVEITVATASNQEVSNVDTAAASEELQKDSATANGKTKEKKRKPKKKKKPVAEAERNGKIELPKGGGFKNISDKKDDDTSSSSLGDDDDEGLEIHVDLDMVDIDGDEKAKSNHISNEEGEVTESLAKRDVIDLLDENEGDDGGKFPLVDQDVAMRQRKYYSAYILPPFRLEEARPYFGSTSGVDFTADVIQERELAAVMAVTFSESKRICTICTKSGHSEDSCQELKCKHCGSWNKHFSHACPDIEKDEEAESRVINHWRRIPAHRHDPIQASKKTLPLCCYYCAGSDHYGDECPRCPPPEITGSFSLSEINLNSYATQEWLLESADKLETLGSAKGNPTFGAAGTKMTVKPALDPFRDLRNFDREDPFPKRAPPAGPSRGKDSYKSRNAHRDGNGASYRQRSPVRDPVFDRYREPLPPRPVHGLPPRPRSRSRSPPRNRNGGRPGGSGGGGGRGGGGGGGRGRGGAHMYGPPSEFHNRPAAREPRRGYESHSQPPLPREPAPRRTEAYRPMPSSAKGNWQKYKT